MLCVGMIFSSFCSIFMLHEMPFCRPSAQSYWLTLMDLMLYCLKVSFHTLLVFLKNQLRYTKEFVIQF